MKLNDAQRSLCLIAVVLFTLVGIFFMADEHGLSAVITFAFAGLSLFVFLSGDFKGHFSRIYKAFSKGKGMLFQKQNGAGRNLSSGLGEKNCSNCKEQNNPTFTHCWKCGHSFVGGPAIQPFEPKTLRNGINLFLKKKSLLKHFPNWSLILLLFIIIGATLTALNVFHQTSLRNQAEERQLIKEIEEKEKHKLIIIEAANKIKIFKSEFTNHSKTRLAINLTLKNNNEFPIEKIVLGLRFPLSLALNNNLSGADKKLELLFNNQPFLPGDYKNTETLFIDLPLYQNDNFAEFKIAIREAYPYFPDVLTLEQFEVLSANDSPSLFYKMESGKKILTELKNQQSIKKEQAEQQAAKKEREENETAAKNIEIISFQAGRLHELRNYASNNPYYIPTNDRMMNPFAFKLSIKNNNNFAIKDIKASVFLFSKTGDLLWTEKKEGVGFLTIKTMRQDFDSSMSFSPSIEPSFVREIEASFKDFPIDLELKIDFSKTKIKIIEAKKADAIPVPAVELHEIEDATPVSDASRT